MALLDASEFPKQVTFPWPRWSVGFRRSSSERCGRSAIEADTPERAAVVIHYLKSTEGCTLLSFF